MKDPVDVSEEGAEMYNVEKILKDKVVKGKRMFLTKWEGWPHSSNTWEPEENFPEDVLQEYLEEKANKGKKGRIKTAEVNSPEPKKRNEKKVQSLPSGISLEQGHCITADKIMDHEIHFRIEDSKGNAFWIPNGEAPSELVDNYYTQQKIVEQEPEPLSKPEPASKYEHKSEPNPKPKPKLKSKSKPKQKPKPDPEPEPEPKPKSKPKQKPKQEPEPEPEPDPEPKPKIRLKKKPRDFQLFEREKLEHERSCRCERRRS
eukprot:TRINITY_DN25002_c0_g1_i1.p1 TRINITY_DN25002_c0_g1~~TRINITY_DN25002_c0_g1_i1.p1  ORF type:complete len:259 (-),score=30.80 TRINITY_DN25002_c0_g1_i1:611-1387(-)